VVRRQLRNGPMEVLRLQGIIPPMHAFRFMSDDLHRGSRVHPCPSEVRTSRVPEIVKPKVRDPSPTAGSVKGRLDISDRLAFVQEHTLGV